MLAAVVKALGEAPRYEIFPEPVAGEGEVAIDVRAAGLHPVVKAIAAGSHYIAAGQLPAVPGVDGVGVLRDGMRVYFSFVRKPWGTMAQRAVAPRKFCIPLPDGIGDLPAAAVANPGMSAWLSLKERARLEPGETVLILGATGVAGQIALQAARRLGAKRVIAAGRNTGAIPAGDADAIVSLNQPEEAIREAFAAEASRGIDVVIDYLWGRPTELLLEGLVKGIRHGSTQRTRLVEVGESAGRSIALPGATLRSIDLMMQGSGFGSVQLDRVLAAIPHLFSLAAAGQLKIDIEPVPLTEVGAAWNRVEKGKRIVFTV